MLQIDYNFELKKDFNTGLWFVILQNIINTNTDTQEIETVPVNKKYDIVLKTKDQAKEFASRVVFDLNDNKTEHSIPFTVTVKK